MNSPIESRIYEAASEIIKVLQVPTGEQKKVGRPITRPEEERTRVKAKKLRRDMTEEEISKMKERMAALRAIKAEKAQARKVTA